MTSFGNFSLCDVNFYLICKQFLTLHEWKLGSTQFESDLLIFKIFVKHTRDFVKS